MKIDRNKEIEKEAHRIVDALIPGKWSSNRLKDDDYAKDYVFEPGESEGQLSGQSFYVQLKGQERVRICTDKATATYSLERKYARYYDKITDLPVFLFVVDVNKKQGYYLFLQEALSTNRDWTNKGSISLRIPVENTLANAQRLREEVTRAKEWLRLSLATAIPDAIKAAKDKIERLDPRLKARPICRDGHVGFFLEPTAPFTMKWKAHPKRSKEVMAKLTEAINRGTLVDFQPGDFTVEGSKVFEKLEHGFKMKGCVEFEGRVTFICKREGDELARLDHVPAKFSGGRQEVTGSARLDYSPLSFTIGPIGATASSARTTFHLNLRAWDGQPLPKLAYFDDVMAFCRGFTSGGEMHVEGRVGGNLLFSKSSKDPPPPLLREVTEYLSLIEKTRRIGKQFNLDPVWSVEAFDGDSRENASRLYSIFFEGGLKEPLPNYQVECQAEETARTMKDMPTGRADILRTTDWYYPILGVEIAVGILEEQYTDMVAIVGKRRGKYWGVTFLGSPDTVRTTRPHVAPS